MIRINSVPGDETSIELTGNPCDLCVEMAILIEHFTQRILERAVDPYEAAPEIRDLFSGAIESALASVKGETAWQR